MTQSITRRTPLGAILFANFVDSELSIPHFIAEIGCQNIVKGIRSFHSFVNTGSGNCSLLDRIQRSRFAIDTEVLLDAITRTIDQLNSETASDQARLAHQASIGFTPGVYATFKYDHTARVTLDAINRDFDAYKATLPTRLYTSRVADEYWVVKSLIIENQRANGGQHELLGSILSYLYFQSPDGCPVEFSTQGNPVGPSRRPVRAIPSRVLANHSIAKRLLTNAISSWCQMRFR